MTGSPPAILFTKVQEAIMPKDSKTSSTPLPDDDLFISVKELKRYVEQVEMAQAKQSVAAFGKAQDAKNELLERLRSNEPISSARVKAFLGKVKTAATSGKTELMIGRFPSDFCTDHGRAINQAEPGWPDTLQGLPRQAYEVWKEKLQPLGYSLKAMIIDWPEGLPGDVGMYLTWKL
jgi:hypothetical protein